MTIDEAKQVKVGQTLYHVSNKNADGSAQRWKVTSVKTWKRSPERIRIGLKYGMYSYSTATEADLHLLNLTE